MEDCQFSAALQRAGGPKRVTPTCTPNLGPPFSYCKPISEVFSFPIPVTTTAAVLASAAHVIVANLWHQEAESGVSGAAKTVEREIRAVLAKPRIWFGARIEFCLAEAGVPLNSQQFKGSLQAFP